MVSRGLQCLKNSASSTTNLYTQALLAYTFSLAGEMDVRNILLEQLDQQAIISGMWSRNEFLETVKICCELSIIFPSLHSPTYIQF